jgi:hypothetical protein
MPVPTRLAGRRRRSFPLAARNTSRESSVARRAELDPRRFSRWGTSGKGHYRTCRRLPGRVTPGTRPRPALRNSRRSRMGASARRPAIPPALAGLLPGSHPASANMLLRVVDGIGSVFTGSPLAGQPAAPFPALWPMHPPPSGEWSVGECTDDPLAESPPRRACHHSADAGGAVAALAGRGRATGAITGKFGAPSRDFVPRVPRGGARKQRAGELAGAAG